MKFEKMAGKAGVVLEITNENGIWSAWIHSVNNGEIVESMTKSGFATETQAKLEGMKAVEGITKALREGGFSINVIMKRSEHHNAGVVH